jgi:hypothetical protein
MPIVNASDGKDFRLFMPFANVYQGRAEQQFHYRTVMMNWLFTPNMTYQDLAAKSMELWNRYLDYEWVAGFGSKDPFESWGTWCVTRRREGMRVGSIYMDVVHY